MYFPGDPLFAHDPIFNSVRDEQARERMVCAFDLASTKPEWALAYRLDIVLRGARPPRPFEGRAGLDPRRRRPSARSSRSGCRGPTAPTSCPRAPRARSGSTGACSTASGEPVPDALVETWQADAEGRYDAPGFRGFGRCPTDDDGAWAILTVKPEPTGRRRRRTSTVSVFARGLLHRVVTRIYFPDEDAANAADPVLSGLDEPARATLVAAQEGDGYRFDVRLQGPDETVFFSV